MKATWWLGRIRGVRIGLHWSALVLIALLTQALAVGALPEAAPGNGPVAYWVAGVFAALLLIVGLLAHELAHVRSARQADLAVSSVTLWLLGGVSQLEAEPEDARTELRVALAGPVCSLEVAVILAMFSGVVAEAGAGDLTISALQWAAGTNALLGLFNLLPGVPLDGGRVLHALLWRRGKDRNVATATAARAGRAIGWGLGTLGLIELVLTGSVGGLWLLMLGWFLAAAADAESRSGLRADSFSGLRVGDVMLPNPITVGNWWTVEDVIARAVPGSTHFAYPVVDLDGAAYGLLRLTAVEATAPGQRHVLTVSQICLPLNHCAIFDADAMLAEELPRLARLRDNDLALVCARSKLVGVLNSRDIGRLVHRGLLLDAGSPQ